jgi:hypothetical protein
MIKNNILTCLVLVFSLGACHDKDDDGCENRVSFDLDVKEYVSYLPDNTNLTIAEKALTVPFFQYYAFDFCKTSNENSKGSITNLIDKTPSVDIPQDAIGIEKNIQWKAEFSNGNVKIFKNETDLVDELDVQKISERLLSCLNMFNSQPLMSSGDFENFINKAESEFTITTLANGDFKLSKELILQGERSETIMSKEFQREIAHAIYGPQNVLKSLHTWFYKINGSSVSLESEMIQTFTPSPDSDKTIVVNRFSKYKNVSVK